MTTDEMLKMLDDWMSDVASALSATAHLDEIQAGGEISSAGAEKNSGALDQQSLEPGMDGSGRRGRTSTNISKAGIAEWIIKTAEQFYTGLGFSPLPKTFLGKIGSVSVAAGFEAEEEHARFLLARRS